MKSINQQFITHILKINNVFEISFNDSFDTIISNDIEHHNLIGKNKINFLIVDLIYCNYFNKIKDEPIFDGLDGFSIYPYNIKIYGAFHHTLDLHTLFLLCANGLNGNKLKYNNEIVDTIDKLKPYFLEYRNGFERGFKSFFNDKINNDLLFNDKDEKLSKIFKYVTTFDNISKQGFSIDFENNLSFTNAFDLGLNNGYNYKAWSYIFDNVELFNEYFKKIINPKINRNLNSNINNGIEYVDVLDFQLNKIISTINQDIQNNCYKYNYFINELETTFLDINQLKSYLTKNKITNTNFLKELINKSDTIIGLWNDDLVNIAECSFEQPKTYKRNGYGSFTTTKDFYCLNILYHKIEILNTEKSRIEFFKKFDYKLFTVCDIAKRCNTIIDTILTAYPELDEFIDLDTKPQIDTNTINENLNLSNNDSNIHPEYKPNYWNIECYELFKYLYDNYYDDNKKQKRKLTNMWFFLKEIKDSKYLFDITQEQYIEFIKSSYNIQITNFNKAEYKYDNEVIKFKNHRINFESLNK